jgi:hypothetical protein
MEAQLPRQCARVASCNCFDSASSQNLTFLSGFDPDPGGKRSLQAGSGWKFSFIVAMSVGRDERPLQLPILPRMLGFGLRQDCFPPLVNATDQFQAFILDGKPGK